MDATQSGKAADPDGDGASNATECVFGSDPNSAGSVLPSSVTPELTPEGAGAFTFRARLDAAALGLSYGIEESADMKVWTPAATTLVSSVPDPDGITTRITVRSSTLPEVPVAMHYRVRVDGL